MRIPNNLFQEGEVDIQDEWIYFVRNYHTIDKVKQNGSGNTALCETRGTITSLNVIGDWIYYVEDANGLYRIRTDGTMQERLIGGYVCDIAYVIGNDIYYSMPTNPQRTTWSVYRYNIETKGFVSVLHGLSSKCFYMNENYIFYTAHPYAGTSSYGSSDYNSQFKVYSLKTKKSHIVFEESEKHEYNIWTDGNYAYWWTTEGIRRVNYTKENTQPEYIYQDTDLRLCF